jgi:hypothetical protein
MAKKINQPDKSKNREGIFFFFSVVWNRSTQNTKTASRITANSRNYNMVRFLMSTESYQLTISNRSNTNSLGFYMLLSSPNSLGANITPSNFKTRPISVPENAFCAAGCSVYRIHFNTSHEPTTLIQ